MGFPNYERQNKWINDYIAPIILSFDIGKIFENYKRNKGENLRNEMAKVGVFNSLERLEREGTLWEKIMSEMRMEILMGKLIKSNLEKQKKLDDVVHIYITR